MIKIERDFDAKRINAILNHPAVRPDVAADDGTALDISTTAADPRHVLLIGDHGGIMFFRLLPGVYEAHTQAVPEGRGAWIVQFAAAAVSWMFTKTDCYEIVTRIPEKHMGARTLAKATGMTLEFTRPGECVWRGERQDIDIYSFRIQDWAADASDMDHTGEVFHDFLHKEAERLGVSDQPHDDDPQHNRYVGISLAMLKAGQVAKAVDFYNRWALVSRHAAIQLVKTDPVTIKFDIGNLVFDNGALRVEEMDIAA